MMMMMDEIVSLGTFIDNEYCQALRFLFVAEKFTKNLVELDRNAELELCRYLQSSNRWNHGQIEHDGTFKVRARENARFVPERGPIRLWAARFVGLPNRELYSIDITSQGNVGLIKQVGSDWVREGEVEAKDVRVIKEDETKEARVVEGKYVFIKKPFYQMSAQKFTLEQVIEKLKAREEGEFVEPVCDFPVVQLDLGYRNIVWVKQLGFRNLGRDRMEDAAILVGGRLARRKFTRPFAFDPQTWDRSAL